MLNNSCLPGDDESLLIEGRPDLCHKCGKCCVSATTARPHKELLQLVEAGEPDAIAFLEVFEPFASIEEARKVVPDQIEQTLRILSEKDDFNINDVTFYHCRYVSETGICTIYERRPRCCRVAPPHGWSVMPPGCGFEGWQFHQREQHRADIRKLKETQFMMETLSEDGVHLPSREMTLDELRQAVGEVIKPWVQFGAEYW